ncbi:YfhO family protein [uncultured Mitsuokella sp.]|uniref:YfhO family protein n=1 Tax=uncultured Mitsuokella sp. TaxID=453120 RepID=UPI00260248CF|nr:YfhO family protein [uncultured Mitsuokella sp.]
MNQTVLSSTIRWRAIGASGLGTLVLLLLLMFANHYAPFGANSFAQADANIQYLDFFSYLKHIFQGDASWTFSFACGIGGNVWVILTYYLFSPWNFLVVLFSQENLHAFYDTLVVIKLSLSAFTMAFYLDQRFKNRLPSYLLMALGMSFGMMQYNMEQARNIMWLDGVYLLPLILWGVYQIRQQKSMLYFIIPSSIAVIFNWYTGLIDLLFAGFWAVWEAALLRVVAQSSWRAIVRFLFMIVLGIALSMGLAAIIFIPTLMEMSNGRVSSLDWRLIHSTWQGSKSSVLKGLTWGTFSSNGHVSLFAGNLVLIGVIGSFFRRDISKKLLGLSFLMLFFLLAVYFWNPLFFLFSLLKSATSYWYRYSYITIFFLVWLSGAFFASYRYRVSKMALLFPPVWIVMQFLHPYNTWPNVIVSSVILLLIVVALVLSSKAGIWKRYTPAFILILVILDLGGNANYIMQHQDAYRFVNVYQDYVRKETEQISSILSADSDFYRISQTRTFSSSDNGVNDHITANYNEGLAYHYPTIASYTSSPVNAHLKFLDHAGYRQGSDNLNVVNTSLLGMDSLLGVRYVLSDSFISGLKDDTTKISANEKDVYRNPFAFPVAFRVSEAVSMHHPYQDNPFVFTDALYADIFQKDIQVYMPLAYQEKESDGTYKAIFTLSSDRQGAVYANFPFHNKNRNALLTVSDTYVQRYACWLSPSVIFVPLINGTGQVQWESKQEAADVLRHAQFYQLDESKLKTASDEAWQKAAKVYKNSDTDLHIVVDADDHEKLFTSIPVHKGWKVLRNGEMIRPEAFEDCLMVIPLNPGHNEITLNFELPGWRLGALCTLVSVIFCFIIERRRFANR